MTALTANTRAELETLIASLGEPASGARRVFRGQSHAYTDETGRPLLLPAVVRPNSTQTYDPAWLVSVQMYLGQKASGYFDITGDLQRLWAPALLQHYGPGSSYLDVTADLDIALWFSFYKLNTQTFTSPLGDMQRSVACAWHTELPQPWPEKDGPAIYVIDAPIWDGKGLPAHGECVDLLAMGIDILPDQATRLRKQSGSLVYVDPASPSLEGSLRAVIRLGADFDRSTVASWGRATCEVFPPPAADPFYKLLLDVPAQLAAGDPMTLRHPLSIPCYLSSPAMASESSIEVRDYASSGPPIEHPLCHQYLLTDLVTAEPGGPLEITLDTGKSVFRFRDATPFLLESPLWVVLPSVKTEVEAGDWIPSALPVGIAPEITGRPTESVYVELCGLDHFYPVRIARDESHETFPRGMWLVRSGTLYLCTVYAVAEGELFSYRIGYRFHPDRGVFERYRWENEDELMKANPGSIQSVFWMGQKALYLTLLLLRDLSPGFKPPSTFSWTTEYADGTAERHLGTLLEPQLGKAISVGSSPAYLIPKALNGTAYVRASGSGPGAALDWRNYPEAFEVLAQACKAVRDPVYLEEARKALAAVNRKEAGSDFRDQD